MIKWFRKKKPITDTPIETMDDRIAFSTSALEHAAISTLDLAQEVTNSLKNKIDDYLRQIEVTSQLINDALIIINHNGKIESFNTGAERIFHWTSEEIIGKDIDSLFNFKKDCKCSNFLEWLACNVDKIDPNDQEEEFKGKTKYGTELFVDVAANLISSNDKPKSYLILIRDITKRVNDELDRKRLAEKNDQLLRAIDSSQIGIIITDPNIKDNPVIFANTGFCNMTGYSKNDILGKNMRILQGQDSYKLIGLQRLKHAVQNGMSATGQVLNYRKDGHSIWCDVHMNPVYDGPILRYWIGILYDVTNLKKTQEELRESEQHFRAFGEASTEAMMIHDMDKIFDWNSRLSSLTGFSNHELSNMNPLDIFHPLEREVIRDKIYPFTDGHFETTVLTKDNDIKEIAINTKIVDWDNIEAMIQVIRDITGYKDVEKLLKGSKERYRTLIDNTVDLFYSFDANFNLIFANSTFKDYFNLNDDELRTTNILDLVPLEDRDQIKDYIQSLSVDNPIGRSLFRMIRNTETKWHDRVDRLITDNKGYIIEYQSISRDVTYYTRHKSE